MQRLRPPGASRHAAARPLTLFAWHSAAAQPVGQGYACVGPKKAGLGELQGGTSKEERETACKVPMSLLASARQWPQGGSAGLAGSAHSARQEAAAAGAHNGGRRVVPGAHHIGSWDLRQGKGHLSCWDQPGTLCSSGAAHGRNPTQAACEAAGTCGAAGLPQRTHNGRVALGVPRWEQLRSQRDHGACGAKQGACSSVELRARIATAADQLGGLATARQRRRRSQQAHSASRGRSPHSRSFCGRSSSVSGSANAPAVQAAGTVPAAQRQLGARCTHRPCSPPGNCWAEAAGCGPPLQAGGTETNLAKRQRTPLTCHRQPVARRAPVRLLPCRCSMASLGRAAPPQPGGSTPVRELPLRSSSARLGLLQPPGSEPLKRLPPTSMRALASDSRPLGSGAPAAAGARRSTHPGRLQAARNSARAAQAAASAGACRRQKHSAAHLPAGCRPATRLRGWGSLLAPARPLECRPPRHCR